MYKKEDYIRKLLLKAVGKSPELFSYYVAIQEAKELLGKTDFEHNLEHCSTKSNRLVTEC